MDNSTILALSGIGLFLFFVLFILPLAMDWGLQKSAQLVTKKLRQNGIINALKKRTFAGNLFYLYCWLMYAGGLIIMAIVTIAQVNKPWSLEVIGGILMASFITFKLSRYIYLFSQLRQPKTETPGTEHP